MSKQPTQFKLNDKVKVLKLASQMERNGIKVGDTVTVTAAGVDENCPRVYVNGLTNHGLGFDEDRFELAAFELPTPVALKVGDKVKVLREGVNYDKDGMGPGKIWSNIWLSRMNASIGKEFTIAEIKEAGAYFAGDRYLGYPLNVLKRVDEPTYVRDYSQDGVIVKLTEDDIMDFMRVQTKDGLFIVFTNARVPGLPKYLTRGAGKATKLNLEDVLEVYSQPTSGDILSPTSIGKLRFKAVDVAALDALKANVVKAEAALVEAKAALASV